MDTLILSSWNTSNPTYGSLLDIINTDKVRGNVYSVTFDDDYSDMYSEELANVKFSKVYDELAKGKSWVDIARDILKHRTFDFVNLYGAPFLQSDVRSKIKHKDLHSNVLDFRHRSMLVAALTYAAKPAIVKTFIYDPEESPLRDFMQDIAEVRTHGYAYDDVKVDKLYQESLNRFHSLLHFSKRNEFDEYGFVFGMTALNEARHAEYTKLMRAANFGTERGQSSALEDKFFVNNSFINLRTEVDRVTYLQHLHRARFTYVIPPYAGREYFSPFRFIEAIFCGCYPLVHPECNWQAFASSYGFSILDFEQKFVVEPANIEDAKKALTKRLRQGTIEETYNKLFMDQNNG